MVTIGLALVATSCKKEDTAVDHVIEGMKIETDNMFGYWKHKSTLSSTFQEYPNNEWVDTVISREGFYLEFLENGVMKRFYETAPGSNILDGGRIYNYTTTGPNTGTAEFYLFSLFSNFDGKGNDYYDLGPLEYSYKITVDGSIMTREALDLPNERSIDTLVRIR